MPETLTIEDLGKKVKAKYPGQYNDLSDVDLGQKVKTKYPKDYADFQDIKPKLTPKEQAEDSSRSMAHQLHEHPFGLQNVDPMLGLAGDISAEPWAGWTAAGLLKRAAPLATGTVAASGVRKGAKALGAPEWAADTLAAAGFLAGGFMSSKFESFLLEQEDSALGLWGRFAKKLLKNGQQVPERTAVKVYQEQMGPGKRVTPPRPGTPAEPEPTPLQRGMEPGKKLPLPRPKAVKAKSAEPDVYQRQMGKGKKLPLPRLKTIEEPEPKPTTLQRQMGPKSKLPLPAPKAEPETELEPTVLQRQMGAKNRLPLPAPKQTEISVEEEGGDSGVTTAAPGTPTAPAAPATPTTEPDLKNASENPSRRELGMRNIDAKATLKSRVAAQQFVDHGISPEDVIDPNMVSNADLEKVITSLKSPVTGKLYQEPRGDTRPNTISRTYAETRAEIYKEMKKILSDRAGKTSK